MPSETSYRIAFWVLIALTLTMRWYFIQAVRRSGGQVGPDQDAIRREGKWLFVFRLLGGLTLAGLLALYALLPEVVESLSIGLPGWLRWAGFGLGLVSLAFWTWVQVVLGMQWSAQLRLRQEHHLITSGPYAIVRHPMYVAIVGFAVGLAVLTANTLFAILALLVIAGLVLRVPREEAMLQERFGAEYTTYASQTGGLLPRLRR